MVKRKSTKGQTTIYKAHAYNTKERVTRTLLKTGCELRFSGRVSISCSIIDSTKTSKIILNIMRKTKKMGNTDPIEKKGMKLGSGEILE
jgi:hypothetical protein